jgi:hypothetical protein
MRAAKGLLLLGLLSLSSSGAVFSVDFEILRNHSGDYGSDQFGKSLALGGDFDGDGYGDVATYETDTVNASPSGRGTVRVFSGQDGSQLAAFSGTAANAYYGEGGLAFIPDLDSDGHDELAIGYPRDGTNGSEVGRVDVISGRTLSKLRTFQGDSSTDRFGSAVAAAGDVNGDGTADILVGAAVARKSGWACGLVRVFSGADGSVLFSDYGPVGSWLGFSVAGAGDVDADGNDDFLAGGYADATNGTRSGIARLYSGRDGAILATVLGDDAEDGLGSSVAGLGDLDGDGCADYAVGAPRDEEQGVEKGAVHVFSGRTGERVTVLHGDALGDRFGDSIASIGDVDLDGVPDFIVGATYNDDAGVTAGQAKVFSGADFSVIRTLSGEGQNCWFGMPVAGGGDVDGDGLPDFAVASTGYSVSGSSYLGRVHVYVSRGGEGFVAINDGAEYTGAADVTLLLVRPDAAWVKYRARNAGGAWPDWTDFVQRAPFTLSSGDGEKTVEAEFRDGSGTVSPLLTDTICLDQTAPTGSFVIDGGRAYTAQRSVTLTLQATDPLSGAAGMRMRNEGGSWSWWRAFSDRSTWWLGEEDGLYSVEVQFRDLVGNESPAYSASTTLDTAGPTGSFILVGGRDYLLGDEDVVLDVTAADNAGGSGLDGLGASYDDGLHWTGWVPFTGSGEVRFSRPPGSGLRAVRARVRDRAGNEEDLGVTQTFFLWPELPALSSFAKWTGLLAPEVRVQAFSVGLVAGDSFSAKIKAKSAAGSTARVVLDLLAPGDRERLVTDQYPATAKAPVIQAWPVPATGEYLLVLRCPGGATGTYSLALTVKQGKANRTRAGILEGEPVAFDAVGGSLFSASLAGAGLTAAQVTLSGPAGPIPFPSKEGKGRVGVLPLALDQGTGTYRLAVTSPGPVTFKLSVKLPK